MNQTAVTTSPILNHSRPRYIYIQTSYKVVWFKSEENTSQSVLRVNESTIHFIPSWHELYIAIPEFSYWYEYKSVISQVANYWPWLDVNTIPVQTTLLRSELLCDWFGNIWDFQILRLVASRLSLLITKILLSQK